MRLSSSIQFPSAVARRKSSTPPLPANAEIRNNNFTISPDGAWVAYIVDQVSDDVFELYIVPIDGSASPVKVNGPLVAGGNVSWYQFSPSSKTLVYNADQDVDEQFELFGVPLPALGTPVKLNGNLVPQGDVDWVEFSPDDTYNV